MSPRCVLADDHPAVLAVLTSFLAEEEIDVVATAGDGFRALRAVEAEQPDVVVVDYRMPNLAGAELLRALREAAPDARLVVYTGEADAAVCDAAFAAGASGLVLKEAPLVDLARAVRAACAGERYLDPALVVHALGEGRDAELTPREREVLSLLAEGLSHEEIANRLQLSAETVRTHVRKACRRLGAATRTQAVAAALRGGMID